MKTTKAYPARPASENRTSVHIRAEVLEKNNVKVQMDERGLSIVFPAKEIDTTMLLDAFLEQEFDREEAWSAIEDAIGRRNWRMIRELSQK